MKRTLKWVLAIMTLLALMLLAIGSAAAEPEMKLVLRKPVNPDWEPRRGGASITGPSTGVTCTPYTFTVGNGNDTGVASYIYTVGLLEEGANMTDAVYQKGSEDNSFSYTFYLPGTYVIYVSRYDAEDNEIPSGIEGYDLSCRIRISEDATANNPLTAKVSEVAALCTVAGDAWQTALNLHDWLTHHAYYDYGFEYYGADGVLLEGKGVCNSYARAYILLCKAAGINDICRVTGWAGENHAWNAIMLDGEWYHVDVTWDDPGDVEAAESGFESHDYFCLNDDLISLDHTNDNEVFSTACTSLEANYLLRNAGENWNELGNNIVPEGSYSERIKAQLVSEPYAFTVPCEDIYYVLRDGGYYSGVSASSIEVKRNWTLLAYAMSHTPFELDGGNQTINVIYDMNSNWFTNCDHTWAEDGSGVCTKCGFVCTHAAGFGDDSVCFVCGYECTHENYAWRDRWSGDTTFISVGEPYHLVTGTRYNEEYCTVCGHVNTCNEIVYNNEQDSHSYTADNPGWCTLCWEHCTHPNLDLAELQTRTSEWQELINLDENYHVMAIVCEECKTCPDCYEIQILRREVSETDNQDLDNRKEPHSFNNSGYCDCGQPCAHHFTDGVCDICGYVCQHEIYDNGVCVTCGTMCPHVSFSNGICNICGYACPHEPDAEHGYQGLQPFVVSTYDQPQYRWYSEDQHAVVTGTKHDICDICGYTTEEELITTVEGHEGLDEDGVCDICGMGSASWSIWATGEADLEDLWTQDYIGISVTVPGAESVTLVVDSKGRNAYREWDEWEETWRGTQYSETFYTDCWVIIDMAGDFRFKAIATYPGGEEAEFVCDEIVTYHSHGPLPKPTIHIDDALSTGEGEYTVIKGQDIRFTFEENEALFENGEYKEEYRGLWYIAGLVNENWQTVGEEYRYGARPGETIVFSTDDLQDDERCYISVGIELRGYYRMSEDQELTVVHCEHTWAEDGSGICTKCGLACKHADGFSDDHVCSICGYTCTHENTTWRDRWSEDTVFTSEWGLPYHYATGTQYHEEYCTVCGYVLSSDETVYDNHQENHTYTDEYPGQCSQCWYYCTHPEIDTAEVQYRTTTERQLINLDADYHVMAILDEEYKICPDCHQEQIINRTISETDNQDIDTRKEPHHFHEWGSCDCGQTCSHHFVDGVCETCHYVCQHWSFENGVCRACGYACTHVANDENLENGLQGLHTVTIEYPESHYEWVSGTQHAIVTGETYEYCDLCDYRSDPVPVATNEGHVDEDDDGICDLCGLLTDGSCVWDFNERSGIARVSGYGTVHAPSEAELNKIGDLKNVERIVIEGNFIAVDDCVFAGIGTAANPVRIDFRQDKKPDMTGGDQDTDNALTGAVVICRYYSRDTSWTEGDIAEDVWVYLPVYNPDWETINLVCYENKQWYTDVATNMGSVHYELTPEQAYELTYAGRNITLYEIPEGDDAKVLTDHWDTAWGISFEEGTYDPEGVDLTLPAGTSNGVCFDLNASRLKLILDGSALGENGINRLYVTAGTVEYTGTMYDLYLENTETDETCDVTVTGTIKNLNYTALGNEKEYRGSLKMKGTIVSGTIYGTNSIFIPGLSDADEDPGKITLVEFKGLPNTTINGLQIATDEAEPVEIISVADGWLINNDPDHVTQFGNLSYKQFRYRYHLYSGSGEDQYRWLFQLMPLGENPLFEYPTDTVDIADYNEDFWFKDLIWGDNTEVIISNDGTMDDLVIENPVAGGPGLGFLQLHKVTADVYCPVDRLIVEQYNHDALPTKVTIHNRVDQLAMELRGSGNVITVAAGGSVEEGEWSRFFNEPRYFSNVSGECQLLSNNHLNVLSWKDGEPDLRVILPVDGSMTTNEAELVSGQKLMADVSAARVEPDSPEYAAMQDYLATEDPSGTAVTVFDASIGIYGTDADGYPVFVSGVGTLTENGATFTVANDADEDAYILRLHDENGTMTATPLEDLDGNEDTLTFNSSLFSTYVVIGRGLNQDSGITVSGPATYCFSPDGYYPLTVTVPETTETAGADWFIECYIHDTDEYVYGTGNDTEGDLNAGENIIYIPADCLATPGVYDIGFSFMGIGYENVGIVVSVEVLTPIDVTVQEELPLGEDLNVQVRIPEGANSVCLYLYHMNNGDQEELNRIDRYPDSNRLAEMRYEYELYFQNPGEYRLRAEANIYENGEQVRTVETVKAFTVTGTKPAAPRVSVSSTEVVKDSDIEFTVAPAEQDEGKTVEAVRYIMTDSDGRQMTVPFYYCDHTPEGYAICREIQYNPGTYQYSFCAKINGVWSDYSDPLEITCVSLGQLPTPEVAIPDKLLAGEPLCIHFGHAEGIKYYSVKISRITDGWRTTERIKGSGNQEVVRFGLSEGTYQVTVMAAGEGYDDSDYTEAKTFTVTGSKPQTPAVTYPTGTHYAHERAWIAIQAEGLEEVSEVYVYADKYLSNGNICYYPITVSSPDSPNVYNLYAKINGRWTDAFSVSYTGVEAQEDDDYSLDVTGFPASIQLGQDVTFQSEIPEGAEEFYFSISRILWEENGYTEVEQIVYDYPTSRIAYDYPAHPDQDGNWTIPAMFFTKAGDYDIGVEAWGTGIYKAYTKRLKVTENTSHRPVAPAVTMVNDGVLKVYEDVVFRITPDEQDAPNVTKACLIIRDPDMPDNVEINPFTIDTVMENGSCSYTFNLMDYDTYKRAFTISVSVFDGSLWSEYSEPLEFRFANISAGLGRPVDFITVDPAESVAGSTITVNWKTVEGAEYYKLMLDYEKVLYFGNGSVHSYELETEDLSDGEHFLTVWAYAVGKDYLRGDQSFRLLDPTAKPTVNANKTGIRKNEPVTLTIRTIKGDFVLVYVDDALYSLSLRDASGVQQAVLRLPGVGTHTVRVYTGYNTSEPASVSSDPLIIRVMPEADLVLPAGLNRIESGAFADVKNVTMSVPGELTDIATDAIDKSVTILAPAGSPAATWFKEHGYDVIEE